MSITKSIEDLVLSISKAPIQDTELFRVANDTTFVMDGDTFIVFAQSCDVGDTSIICTNAYMDDEFGSSNAEMTYHVGCFNLLDVNEARCIPKSRFTGGGVFRWDCIISGCRPTRCPMCKAGHPWMSFKLMHDASQQIKGKNYRIWAVRIDLCLGFPSRHTGNTLLKMSYLRSGLKALRSKSVPLLGAINDEDIVFNPRMETLPILPPVILPPTADKSQDVQEDKIPDIHQLNIVPFKPDIANHLVFEVLGLKHTFVVFICKETQTYFDIIVPNPDAKSICIYLDAERNPTTNKTTTVQVCVNYNIVIYPLKDKLHPDLVKMLRSNRVTMLGHDLNQDFNYLRHEFKADIGCRLCDLSALQIALFDDNGSLKNVYGHMGIAIPSHNGIFAMENMTYDNLIEGKDSKIKKFLRYAATDVAVGYLFWGMIRKKVAS